MCGAFASRLPVASKIAQEKSRRLLDIDRMGSLLQHGAHLCGDIHESVVVNFQQDRIRHRRFSRPIPGLSFHFGNPLQHELPGLIDFKIPACCQQGRAVCFSDEGQVL